MMQTTTTTQDHERTRVDTPDPVPPTRRGPTDREPRGTLRAAVVAAVLLFVVAATLWVTSRPTPDEAIDTAPSVAVSNDEALRRLIARGYVPGQAFDARAEATSALQQRGLVPDGAAIPPPLYTPEERTVLRLVRAGVLPDELLDSEVFVTKQLVNRGLVPPGSAR